MSNYRAYVIVLVLALLSAIVLSQVNANLVPSTFGVPVIVGPGGDATVAPPSNTKTATNEQNPSNVLFNNFPTIPVISPSLSNDNNYGSPVSIGKMPFQFQTITNMPFDDSSGMLLGYPGPVYSLPAILSDIADQGILNPSIDNYQIKMPTSILTVPTPTPTPTPTVTPITNQAPTPTPTSAPITIDPNGPPLTQAQMDRLQQIAATSPVCKEYNESPNENTWQIAWVSPYDGHTLYIDHNFGGGIRSFEVDLNAGTIKEV